MSDQIFEAEKIWFTAAPKAGGGLGDPSNPIMYIQTENETFRFKVPKDTANSLEAFSDQYIKNDNYG